MDEKMTNKIIDSFFETNQQMIKYMANIEGALKAINDTNILHKNALHENTDAIKLLVRGNSAFMRIFTWILVALVLAIIVLAGAEKALKFIPL